VQLHRPGHAALVGRGKWRPGSDFR